MTTNGTVTRTAAGAIAAMALLPSRAMPARLRPRRSRNAVLLVQCRGMVPHEHDNGGADRRLRRFADRHQRHEPVRPEHLHEQLGTAQLRSSPRKHRATVTSSATYDNNQWHHVVGIVGDTGMSLYVDGANVGTRPDTRTGKSYNGYWRLGGDTLSGWSNRPTSDYFNGSIDDVAVYRQALAGNQVRAHYLAAGAALAVPSDSYGKAVYDNGPDLYWRFRESSGTSAADSSLNGQTGTYAGSPTLGGASAVNDVADKSITLNGTTGNVASNNTSLTSPQVYSEEAWIKTTTTTGGQIMGSGPPRPEARRPRPAGLHDERRDAEVRGVPVQRRHIDHVAGRAALQRRQVAPRGRDPGTGRHEALRRRHGCGDGSTVNSLSYNGYWRVGGDNLTGRSSKPTSTYFAGSVDEVAVYPQVLSASEVASHFTKAEARPRTRSRWQRSPRATRSWQRRSTPPARRTPTAASPRTRGTSVTAPARKWQDHQPQLHGRGHLSRHLDGHRRPGRDELGRAERHCDRPAAQPEADRSVHVQLDRTDGRLRWSGSADTDGTIASYDWDFGDGTTHGGGQSPTHPYGAPAPTR